MPPPSRAPYPSKKKELGTRSASRLSLVEEVDTLDPPSKAY
ncbi:hypothetical protein CLOSTMETH_00776 [[Clostridium] methylpentosum DSM 5476]|uniref:Uncharacterized protein n=1 Tax=[Clostridium] methylpentosum DSM 5476 TaxID=537013 RepID=C0EAC2_9FIRM|nr:hypothetical protein CLOSTMETH_00776 [[Clostridium] methylpentosum DSM 5476]